MSKLAEIDARLMRGEEVFIADEFHEMALRIFRNKDGQVFYCRKRHKGFAFPEELPIDPKQSNTAFEVMLGGKFISEQEFDSYDKNNG